jgi:hypothetical protein
VGIGQHHVAAGNLGGDDVFQLVGIDVDDGFYIFDKTSHARADRLSLFNFRSI